MLFFSAILAKSNSSLSHLIFVLIEFVVTPLNAITPSFRTRRYVHFGVCAPQSASFALATTHSPDVLLNASRPTTRKETFLYNIIRRSRGRQRHSHKNVSSPCYATRSPIKTTRFTCTNRQVRRSTARRLATRNSE